MKLTAVALLLCACACVSSARLARKHHKRGVLGALPSYKLGHDIPHVTHSVVKPVVVTYPPAATVAAVKVPLSHPLLPRYPVGVGRRVPHLPHPHYGLKFPHHTKASVVPEHFFHHHHHHVAPRPLVPVVPATPVVPAAPVAAPAVARPVPAPPAVLTQPAPLPPPVHILPPHQLQLRPIVAAAPAPVVAPAFSSFVPQFPYILRPGGAVQSSVFASYPRYPFSNYPTPLLSASAFSQIVPHQYLVPQAGAGDGVVLQPPGAAGELPPHSVQLAAAPGAHLYPSQEVHFHSVQPAVHLQPEQPGVHLQAAQPELHFQPGVPVQEQPDVHLQAAQPELHYQPGVPLQGQPDVHLQPAQQGFDLQPVQPEYHLQAGSTDAHLQPDQPDFQYHSGAADAHLHPQPDYHLQPQPDYNHQPQPDYHLQPQPDYNLQSQPEYHHQPQPDYQPQPQPDYHQQPQPDYHFQSQPDYQLQLGQADGHLQPTHPDFHLHGGQQQPAVDTNGWSPVGDARPGGDAHYPGDGHQHFAPEQGGQQSAGEQQYHEYQHQLQQHGYQPAAEYGAPAEGRSAEGGDEPQQLYHNHIPLGLQPPLDRPLDHFR